MLRRMGLSWLLGWMPQLAQGTEEDIVSWQYIQPLPAKIGPFQGDVRLKVLKDKLADMHPVDLADILEEMDPEQRVEIFQELPTEQASDTLEEIEPSTQRDLVAAMETTRVAQLIDEMTTGQAADVLSVLSAPEAAAILKLLNPENAHKIRAIMEKQEEHILNFATREFLAFPPNMTVERAQDEYRRAARGKNVVMYLYIVDEDLRLLGVLDIKELLQADDKAHLDDVMVRNVISLNPDSTLKEAAQLFDRYDFRALPIVDSNDRIVGVVTYRDVMQLKHHFVE